MKLGWQKLRSKLDLEPETELGLYLGCQLVRGQTKLKDGTKVSTITYDMESFLEQSVQKYLEDRGEGRITEERSNSIASGRCKRSSCPSSMWRGSCQSMYVVWNGASHHGTDEIQVSSNQHQCTGAGR